MRRSVDRASRVRRLVVYLGLAGLLAGCASPTGYEPAGVLNDGHGWRDRPIGPDEYSVVAQGNVHTSADRTARIALLRAAHLTREQGREHFEVFESEAARRAQDVTSQMPVRTGGITIFVPMETRRSSQPVAVLLIRLLPAGATPTPGILEARAVIADLEDDFR